MTSEADIDFVGLMKAIWDSGNVLCEEDADRLFALARRGAAVQWRPISEAPMDGTPILGCVSGVMATVSFRYGDFSLIECGRCAEDGVWWPDHWMPLPPPPAGEPSDE